MFFCGDSIPLPLRFLLNKYIHMKKAQTSCCLLTVRGLRIALQFNKQQEAYADMTNCSAMERQSRVYMSYP